MKPVLASVAGKALASLTKRQGVGDLYRMYVQAKRDGIDYTYFAIPESFTLKEPKPFDIPATCRHSMTWARPWAAAVSSGKRTRRDTIERSRGGAAGTG